MLTALDPAGLLALLHTGDTVVLPSSRAAEAWRSDKNRQQQEHGRRAWPAAPIFTWEEWTATLWRTLLLDGADDRILLNELQEDSLWADIITASPREAVLSPTAVVELSRLARSGFALAAQARALERISGSAESYDARAFAAWYRTFSERCRADRVLPAALLEHALAQHAAKVTLLYQPCIRKLQIIGFDHLSPARNRLLKQLEANGSSVLFAPLRDASQKATLRSAVIEGGPADEARWAIRSLRQSFEQSRNAHARFALVLPDPAAEQSRLTPLLREILTPELESIFADPSSTPWQFGQDPPLASLPIIEHALCVLRWLQNPLPIEQIGSLLLSPFFSHSEPYEDRARFEVQGLRRSLFLRPELTLRQMLSLTRKPLGQAAVPALLLPEWQALHGFLNEFSAGPRLNHTGAYADWIEKIRKVLQFVGWPGPRALSAAEFRAVEGWEALLDGLATLDLQHRPVSFAVVMEGLEREAKRVPCPSSRDETPVQILGLSETEGCSFDRVILLRANDNQLPLPEHLHPLLGYSLQRDAGMPGTDAAQTYAETRSRLANLVDRCGDLLLTTAAIDEHGDLRLTPLAADLGCTPVDAQELLPAAVTPPPLALEVVPDTVPLPTLPSPQISGGAGVLELQAACGFRAFASFRLGATVPEDHGLGLDARATGSLLHRAMELFWTENQTQAALRAMDEAEQRSSAARAVSKAIAPWRAAVGTTDTWASAYLDLVQQRLVRLITQWLHHELERGDFLVLPPEQKQTVPIGPLELSIRPDRIDKVDGGYVFIDYKTSANLHTNHWLGDRPEAPQLPLYALLAEPDEVRGLAFARVRPGKDMAWLSMEDEAGIFPAKRNRSLHNLNDHLEAWRTELERLAVDFAEGNTDIDPKTFPHTCQHCAHRLLCRLDAETLLASEENTRDRSPDPEGGREG